MIRNRLKSGATLTAVSAALAMAGAAFAHPPHGHGSGWEVPESEIQRENPIPPNEHSLVRGQSLYTEHCLRCHGTKLQGEGPDGTDLDPPPANLIEHAPHHTDGDFAYRIRTGRGPMPAFTEVLGEKDIWHLVNFLKDEARSASLAGSGDHPNGHHEDSAPHGGPH